jgi:hypothetical protein
MWPGPQEEFRVQGDFSIQLVIKFLLRGHEIGKVCLSQVRVNGSEYKPSVASPNKKQAKAEAATICLQALGVLPP